MINQGRTGKLLGQQIRPTQGILCGLDRIDDHWRREPCLGQNPVRGCLVSDRSCGGSRVVAVPGLRMRFEIPVMAADGDPPDVVLCLPELDRRITGLRKSEQISGTDCGQ